MHNHPENHITVRKMCLGQRYSSSNVPLVKQHATKLNKLYITTNERVPHRFSFSLTAMLATSVCL